MLAADGRRADPKAYTKPWTVTLRQAIVLNTELLDELCVENEKDIRHLVGKWSSS